MRISIYSLLLALSFFGCRSVKEKRKEVIYDSVRHQSVAIDSSIQSTRIEQKDTAIVVPFVRVSGPLSVSDLLPNYTAKGKPVTNRLEIRNGNLKSFITIHPDSSIEYGAEFDSMVLVVKNLYREVSELKTAQRSDNVKEVVSRSDRMEWREMKPFFQIYGPWIALALLVIVSLPKSKK